jgi:acetolactate synthase-1/2/3 large subunit
MPDSQELIPKIIIKMRPDGTFINTPLEDLYPFLSRKQLEEEMIIPLIDDQTT